MIYSSIHASLSRSNLKESCSVVCVWPCLCVCVCVCARVVLSSPVNERQSSVGTPSRRELNKVGVLALLLLLLLLFLPPLSVPQADPLCPLQPGSQPSSPSPSPTRPPCGGRHGASSAAGWLRPRLGPNRACVFGGRRALAGLFSPPLPGGY